MEDYQIVLSPDLGLRPADFVTAWNEETEARTMAEARLAVSPSEHYDPTLLVTILLTVATGAASNVLSDLILRVVDKKKNTHTHTRIVEQKQPDGSRLLVVDIDDD